MKKYILPLLILILSLPAIFALFHPGFFPTDDGNWMVIRFSAFFEALRHGQFPVRFLPRLNQEFGYPVADFLYPLFMYLGVPIHILGFSFLATIKIILGLSMLLSGFFAFLWLQRRFSPLASFTGAIIFILFPYHVWDMYTRGSVGEVVGLMIIPFVFWQLERKSIPLVSTGIALIILAHNVLALLFLPIILLYAIYSKFFSIKKIGLLFGLGLALSAFFWIPALLDKQYTIFDKTSVSDFSSYFIYPANYSLIGVISICIILFSLYAVWKQKEVSYWLVWIGTILTILLTLPVTAILWKFIPGTGYIQFPFRLLSLTTLGMSFLVAYGIDFFKKRYVWIVASAFIAVAYASSFFFFMPKAYELYPDSYYATNVDTTTVQNEYMPIWVHKLPTGVPSEKVFIPDGVGTIMSVSDNVNSITVTLHLVTQSLIQVNTIYFPGWIAVVDGKKQEINYNNTYGVIQLTVSPGNHVIMVLFTETVGRLLSDILSIIACIIVVGLLIQEQRKRHV